MQQLRAEPVSSPQPGQQDRIGLQLDPETAATNEDNPVEPSGQPAPVPHRTAPPLQPPHPQPPVSPPTAQTQTHPQPARSHRALPAHTHRHQVTPLIL